MIKNRLVLLLFCCSLLISLLAGCGTRSNVVVEIDDAQVRNLAKLCKVWGFAKYTHQSFLTGERCWDEELLALIPVIRFADEDEVNDILYEWFVGLGDDGYDLDWEAYRVAWEAYYEGRKAYFYNWFIELIDAGYQFDKEFIQSQLQVFDDAINFMLEYGDVSDWADLQVFHEAFYSSLGMEQKVRQRVDKEWITDASFLGEALSNRLSRFVEIQIFDRSNAPVYFDPMGRSFFTNQKDHRAMGFSDIEYRLLGLFRLWNTIKYFYPHMDIIDYDWNELLLDYIPIMLERTDRISYRNTLISLARRLDDAHVRFDGLPVHEIIWHDLSRVTSSHVLLENNIGLINPVEFVFNWGDTRYIMETFADTDGLIIDLRQYPCGSIVFDLAEYIVEESQPFFILSFPAQSIPGVFIDQSTVYSGGITSPYAFFYDRPVVILMNRSTMSRAETAVMSLRNGKNVTVMGSNSIGGNGDVTFLPLPGGIQMMFTGLGVYTPQGGQTHRIGLSPDIHVEPTAAGLREGRDELMEAAIAFLLAGEADE